MGDTLITSTSNRINFSADGGNTWYSQVMGQNIYRTRALFIHADHSIFIGGEHGQIFKTKKPTIPLSVKNGRVGFLDYVVAQGDRIVAMSSFGVVVYSNDGGENWAEKQLTNDNIGGLIFVGDRLMGMDNHGLIEFDENFDVTIKAALDHWASDMEYSQVMNTLYLTTANTLMMTSDEDLHYKPSLKQIMTFPQSVLTMMESCMLLQIKERYFTVKTMVPPGIYFISWQMKLILMTSSLMMSTMDIL
ncbi:MAG: hypothetical protein IPL13_12610 [Saprospiraceae bacterium]|nr:hypothetical protein [Candidatus Brachybacter algidus]